MNILEISAVQTQTVTAGDYLVFDTTNLKRGFAIHHVDGSNNVHIGEKGIYIATFNADVIPTGAGAITITFLKGGPYLRCSRENLVIPSVRIPTAFAIDAVKIAQFALLRQKIDSERIA